MAAKYSNYETVAASQTAQPLGTTGTIGDRLERLIVVPATTSPGVVTVIDGVSPATPVSFTAFTGGATSVATLTPFVIEVGAVSVIAGGWRITTGANVSVVAIGKFI